MKYLWAFPPQTYHCRHVDLKKSKPWIDERGGLQNKDHLPFWTPTETYIRDLAHFQELLEPIQKTEVTIVDKQGRKELIKYWVEEGTTGSKDGILGLRYSEDLLAYRIRDDGLLGLESLRGDTRLSATEKSKRPNDYPARVKAADVQQAHFNTARSIFVIK